MTPEEAAAGRGGGDKRAARRRRLVPLTCRKPRLHARGRCAHAFRSGASSLSGGRDEGGGTAGKGELSSPGSVALLYKLFYLLKNRN